MYPRITLSFLLLTVCSYAFAQEINFGLHTNPTITVPTYDDRTVSDEGLRMSRQRLNFNYGLNVNFKMKYINIGTGINLLSKSVSFNQKTEKYEVPDGEINLQAKARATIRSSSLEIPLEINWLLHHHAKNSRYDLYFVTGASYELNTVRHITTKGQSVSGSNREYSAGISTDHPNIGKQADWVNVVAGFKINTIIKKIGLIDYGLVYHTALSDVGLYSIKSVVNNNTTSQTYNAYYYPSLSYLDIRLTYYFLNFEKGFKRKKYKSPNKSKLQPDTGS